MRVTYLKPPKLPYRSDLGSDGSLDTAAPQSVAACNTTAGPFTRNVSPKQVPTE